jgi:hypothetical protein
VTKLRKCPKIYLEVEMNHCDGWPSKEDPLKMKVEMKKGIQWKRREERLRGNEEGKF